MNPQERSHFVQIAVAMAPQQANLIYALDSAGGVWFYRDTKKKWVRVPDEREEQPGVRSYITTSQVHETSRRLQMLDCKT
jgi:hypothetical protein